MATKTKTIKKKIVKSDLPKIICQNKDCDKMGKHQTVDNFYKSKNESMPYHPFCKDCVNKIIDINNIDTVKDVLKSLDLPFIMDEWVKVIKEERNSYIAEYLKIINITQRKKYENKRFEDSIYDLSEVEDIIEESNDIINNSVPQFSEEWQGYYTINELNYLNNYLSGLNADFKIVNTNHKDYARKIAQASLAQSKAYQSLLAGKDGAEVSYEKATKIFDSLCKSAQFSENTRGANDVSLGCFGKIFDLVEKNNWVPQHVPHDEDLYDKMLKQFANIERSL